MHSINFDEYLSVLDIVSTMKVSKDWISKNIRPAFQPVSLEEANETSNAVKARNTLWYRKQVFYDHILANIKVYTRDYLNSTERKRGEEIETDIPQIIIDEIRNEKFQYYNLKDIMNLKHFNTYEMAYRWLYSNKALAIKIFGKTYYYIPETYI